MMPERRLNHYAIGTHVPPILVAINYFREKKERDRDLLGDQRQSSFAFPDDIAVAMKVNADSTEGTCGSNGTNRGEKCCVNLGSLD
jgi:hypothetical protein